MLSHLVRRQLRELRIDPDTIITARRWPPRWLRVSRFVDKDALLISLGSAAALLLIIVIALVVTLSVSPPQSGAQTGSTVVSFGDTAVPLSAPSYRRMSKGTTVVDVRLKLGNQGSGRAVLLAGDVLLVDSRQAIFPMSWQATDGTWHDGLAEPDHALIGLDPGEEVTLDASYLTTSIGPFTLRYERSGGRLAGALPTLTLDSKLPLTGDSRPTRRVTWPLLRATRAVTH